jgi:hypothetical protein
MLFDVANVPGFAESAVELSHVHFAPKADMCGATRGVYFGPRADMNVRRGTSFIDFLLGGHVSADWTTVQ